MCLDRRSIKLLGRRLNSQLEVRFYCVIATLGVLNRTRFEKTLVATLEGIDETPRRKRQGTLPSIHPFTSDRLWLVRSKLIE